MISTDTSTATGVLTSSTQTIVLGFYFMANTDLVVTRTRAGVITTLTLDSDYSVLGAGNEKGGSITVTGQASGDVITIVRTVDYKQLSNYVPLTKLSATTIERDFDRCAMRDQQIVRRVKDLEDNPSSGIKEAPIDGTPYARQDAAWTPLTGGGDMLKSTYDTVNRGYVDRAVIADTATTSAALTGDIAQSQVTGLATTLSAKADTSSLGDSASKNVGTTTGTVAAGDDARIIAGGAALQPTGSGASLTGITAAQVGAVPTSRTVNGHALTADVTVTKGDVGLGSVDNTSDANKPVSTAQAAAIALKQDASTALALGETSGTAYRGDRGKTAYDHSQITSGNPHGTTAAQVGAATAAQGALADSAVQPSAIVDQTFSATVSTNPYSATPALTPRRIGDRAYNTTSLEWWDGIATAGATTSWQLAASGGGGSGDMTKAVYDTVNRGYVDRAVLADTATTAGTISGSITISQVTNLSSELSAIIEEAPIDGTSYARKDATWVSLAGGGDMLKSVYDTDNDGKVDSAEVADSATYATTAGTISGSITISQVSDAGSAATKAVGTTTGTVAAGDDSRIVAGGTALQPTGSGASLTGMTASQVGLGNVDNTSDANKPVSSATQTALNAKQPLDADLTAIAALAGTAGILIKTAANTWTLDTSTYLTTSVASSTYQPLDADLTAIAGLTGTTGILTKTAADTWSLDTNVYLTGNETITLSGDATGSGATSITVTFANTGVSAGSYGSATAVPAITVDAKGRVTAVTATSIQIAESQVTDLGTALSAKAPVDNPTFTTGITTPAANITGLTASRALVSDASKNVTASAVTSTELGYVHGVTSAIQTQIDGKAPAITPINAQTGTTYSLVAADAGKIVTCTNASAITVTVPASTFSAGKSVIIGQGGVGQVTLAAGSGMTLHTTTTLKAKAQYARIAVMFDSASEGTVIGERAAS